MDKFQMISWLGQLARMEEDRMPKKIFTEKLEGTRRRGRPRKRWKEEVLMKEEEESGTTIDWTTMRESAFCNFDLTYHPCCIQPPPPSDIPSDEGESL